MSVQTQSVPSRRTTRWSITRRVLLASLAIHLLFGLGAGFWVVSRYAAARKLTFSAGPRSPNHVERAIQHRVQLREKSKNAPAAIPKRVLTKAVAKVELPPLPAIPGEKSTAAPPLMSAAGRMLDVTAPPAKMGSIGGTGTGASINFFGIRDKSSSVVIMIDVSDSMFTRTGDAEGRKLTKRGKEQNFQAVRDEAIKLVESLGPNVSFGIVRWSGGAYPWKPELLPATDENKTAAISHIQDEVDMKTAHAKKGERGGTRHDLALQEAFNLKPEVIYMLTDGNATAAQPGGGLKPIAPDELFRVADAGQKSLGRRARLHVIYYVTGADRDEERQMLMSLAARNSGQFRPINARGRKG